KMTWPHRKQAPSLKKARGDRQKPPPPRLRDHTTMGVGGHAAHFVQALNEADVLAATRYAKQLSLPLYPLGGGSNLVVSDDGVRGLVLKLSMKGINVTHQGDDVLVTAAAGEVW